MSSGIPLTSVREPRKRRNASTNESDNNQKDGDAEADLLSGALAGTTVPENFNSYRYKKMLAQGLMDLSLFSANANQLRFILEYGSKATAPCYILASFIILSLILQVGVGVMLLLSSRFNVDEKDQRLKVYQYGNNTTIAIFLITVINVFIAAFGGTVDIAQTSSGMPTFANNTNAALLSNSTVSAAN